MNLNLRQKINAAILTTFVVISLVYIAIQLPLQNRRSETVSKQVEKLLRTLVERDREPLANEIYQNLTRALTIRLEQMQEIGNILSISVFDKTGNLLVSQGKYPETRGLSESEMAGLDTDAHIHYQLWQKQFSIVYMQEIQIIGERIGLIRIFYSLEDIKREQRLSWLILGCLLGSIFIVMLILLNLIMSRTIVRPILSLSKRMEKMQAGKIEQYVYRKTDDEIGLLSGAFNKMSRDLAASYQELEKKGLQLQEAQKYLSNIINSMPSLLLGVDTDMTITLWNSQAEKSTGIEAENAKGKTLARVFPLLADLEEKIQQALRDGTVKKEGTVSWGTAGEPEFVDITIYPLITNGVDGAVIRIDNVTERKLIQEALRESQEKYRILVEHSNDAIFVSQDEVVKFANPRAETISGYTSDELAVMPFINLVIDEDKDKVLASYEARLAGRTLLDNYVFRIRNKSGKMLWVSMNAVTVSWEDRPATLNFFRDITDQKKAEDRLLHAQKMEAVGTLASGIAHDFNNLLQIIQGYTQLLLFDNMENKMLSKELEAILRAAMKGGELTAQLLTFGRKMECRPLPLNINKQIEKTEKMLSRTIPKMINIRLELAENLHTVSADPMQIEQVVMNLVINARDAMPYGGSITIETENVLLDENSCKAHLLSDPGEYIRVCLSDTGHGMEKEVMDHIFEPFFSTKKAGEGTGLGLAIVYGIIKSHNGAIQCYSLPGEGTTFKMYFPAIVATGELIEEKSSPPFQHGTETVLMVDDEETLRDIGKEILEKFGYTVLTATDGEGALEIYQSEQPRIHLVILDLIMPGMSGEKCLEAILKINPKTKVIIASGYLTEKNKTACVEAGALGFIKKPFVLEIMLNEIRRVLDE